MQDLSADTQVALLLTAPLIVGRQPRSSGLLKPAEFRRLVERLQGLGAAPGDLLQRDRAPLLATCQAIAGEARLAALLGRAFQLSQAVEHWQARGIWVVGQGDEGYPSMLCERLGAAAPLLLYGSGELANAGCGLAVVGSRNASNGPLAFAAEVAATVAEAKLPVVSGCAKGVDRAAMNGALAAGGNIVGVVPAALERAALNREHRDLLLGERLLLVSAADPRAGFNVGLAMHRNKIIYALADAGLVVDAVPNAGGTWAGATEQLEKYRTPLFVRGLGEDSAGLAALLARGAAPWPNPESADALADLLREARGRALPRAPAAPMRNSAQAELLPEPAGGAAAEEAHARPASAGVEERLAAVAADRGSAAEEAASPSELLFRAARPLVAECCAVPSDAAAIATMLGVTRNTLEPWLKRMVNDRLLTKRSRPVRYIARQQDLLGRVQDAE